MQTKPKINVAILFGGRSAEHEVSIRSAQNVYEAIDKEKYQPILIGIDKVGQWLLNSDQNLKTLFVDNNGDRVALIPGSNGQLLNFSKPDQKLNVDVVFPVLHGPFGEDGTIQGLLKLANIPFVGAGILGSAVGMDKDVMKRLLKEADIPVAKFLVFHDFQSVDYYKVLKQLGLPFFIKPANLGSSVGISKVKSKDDFKKAITEAFQFDSKIIIEEFIEGREIECSVLGNDKPKASVPGEIIVKAEFYSYDAKYVDENGAVLKVPAKLPTSLITKIQDMAVKAYQVLCCEGMARVDFFVKNNKEVFVNEINTIPGFTSISMYPKLWEASGLSYTQLIDKLITLALERFNKEQKLKTSY